MHGIFPEWNRPLQELLQSYKALEILASRKVVSFHRNFSHLFMFLPSGDLQLKLIKTTSISLATMLVIVAMATYDLPRYPNQLQNFQNSIYFLTVTLR